MGGRQKKGRFALLAESINATARSRTIEWHRPPRLQDCCGYAAQRRARGLGWRQKTLLSVGGFMPQAATRRNPSSSRRTNPERSSATPTDSDTETSASLRPTVLSITANVEMQGM